MLVIGLTGGIGSGKSTVGELLVALGAALIDADKISREVVAPGAPALAAVVERFGDGVLLADGNLDRPALAAVVFGDDEARLALNAIMHPAIGAEMGRRLAAQAGTDQVVLLDIPLLAEGQARREQYGMAGIVVVDTPIETAVERLVGNRGMAEADARARIAAQATREARRAIADHIVDNAGDRSALEAEVDRAWAWIQTLR